MEDVRKRRRAVLITKKGVGVAKLVPIEGTARDVFGCLAEEIESSGDIETPVVASTAWGGHAQ